VTLFEIGVTRDQFMQVKWRRGGGTDLNEMTSEPSVTCHRSLEVHLASDCELTCTIPQCKEPRQLELVRGPRKRRERETGGFTQISSRQSFVGQPDLEPTLIDVPFRDGQTATVDGDRISEVAIGQDVSRLRDCETVTFEFGSRLNRRDLSQDLGRG
jgi:hypothetical protein